MNESKHQLLENRIQNINTEFYCATIAVIISFIYRAINDNVLDLERIFYVVVWYFIHMILQAFIFNKWDFNHLYVLSRHWFRIISILLVLTFSYFDLNHINFYFKPFFVVFSNERDNYHTFIAMVMYCSIYYLLILLKYKYVLTSKKKGKL
jgi:hypothetical protein